MTILRGGALVCAAALAVAALGCKKGSSVNKCATAWPEVVSLAACLAPSDGWKEGELGSTILELEATGKVVKVEQAAPSDACARVATGVWRGDAPAQPGTSIELVASDGRAWTGVMMLGTNTVPAKVGDEISIRYSVEDGGHGGANTSSMIVKRDQELLGFYKRHYDLKSIGAALGVDVRQGDISCRNPVECGAWELYDLKLKESDLLLSLPYGGSVDSGGLRYLHGGYTVANYKDGSPGGCRHFGSDSGAAVGAVRLP